MSWKFMPIIKNFQHNCQKMEFHIFKMGEGRQNSYLREKNREREQPGWTTIRTGWSGKGKKAYWLQGCKFSHLQLTILFQSHCQTGHIRSQQNYGGAWSFPECEVDWGTTGVVSQKESIYVPIHNQHEYVQCKQGKSPPLRATSKSKCLTSGPRRHVFLQLPDILAH